MTQRAAAGAIEVTAGFHVRRPRHDVYEFLVDTGHFRQVDQALVAFEPGGRMVVGMHGTMLHRRAKLPARSRWEVVDLVPDERLLVRLRGLGYEMTEDVRLEDHGGGTAMRVIDRLVGTSRLGKVFVRLSAGQIRRDLTARGSRLEAALGSG